MKNQSKITNKQKILVIITYYYTLCVVLKEAISGAGHAGAGQAAAFRVRRLRPLLPVVFCGIGRTADAPKRCRYPGAAGA